MEMQLPFLITTLVSHNKQISGIVSSHVQWLEKLLADVEKALLAREASNKKSNHAQELKELKCIYILLKPWNTEFRYEYSCTLYQILYTLHDVHVHVVPFGIICSQF